MDERVCIHREKSINPPTHPPTHPPTVPFPLTIIEEITRPPTNHMLGKEEEELLGELKSGGRLPEDLVHAVQPLNEDGRTFT